jgi:glycosyltransferase involved in cell wall biosynthesis
MKKILFINHSPYMYGAETVMYQVLKRVALHHPENAFVVAPLSTFGKSENVFIEQVRKLGIHHCRYMHYKSLGGSFFRSAIALFYNIYALINLYHWVRCNKIDIIYSNTCFTCIGVVLAKLTRKPHIWHFHEPIDHTHGWKNYMCWLYKILFLYKKNRYIFISQTQKKDWERLFPAKFNTFEIIYNPINEVKIMESISSTVNKNNVVFGYMGNWAQRKNIPFLLKAFSDLYSNNPNIELILAKNNGDDEERIIQTIEQLNLQNRVQYNVWYDNLSDFYACIDIFVLPSLSESWGMVVLEAVSAHKPCIVTQNTALTEIFADQRHCCYIDPHDNTSLLLAMQKMLNDEFRTAIAKNAYDKLHQCTFNRNFEEAFQKLFNN